MAVVWNLSGYAVPLATARDHAAEAADQDASLSQSEAADEEAERAAMLRTSPDVRAAAADPPSSPSRLALSPSRSVPPPDVARLDLVEEFAFRAALAEDALRCGTTARRDDAGEVAEFAGTNKQACVVLLTVHSAKGLEWPVVYVPRVCEGMYPHYFSKQQSQIDEDIRVLFVAASRAQDKLALSWTSRGRNFTRSRFLAFTSKLAASEPGLIQFEL
jgi:hypothetical protein